MILGITSWQIKWRTKGFWSQFLLYRRRRTRKEDICKWVLKTLRTLWKGSMNPLTDLCHLGVVLPSFSQGMETVGKFKLDKSPDYPNWESIIQLSKIFGVAWEFRYQKIWCRECQYVSRIQLNYCIYSEQTMKGRGNQESVVTLHIDEIRPS